MKRKVTGLVMEPETGEIVNEIREGDVIRRYESIEYFNQRRKANKQFVKADINEGLLVLPLLTANERSLLFLLQYYTSYDTCAICHSNGTSLSFNDIVGLSGWSRSTAKGVLDGLIDKKILACSRRGSVRYYMNPWILSRGNKAMKEARELFKDYRIKSRGNRTWEEIEKGNGKD